MPFQHIASVGPVIVSGGHVDTVGTVDSVALVQAVVDAVTVAGGTIDTVAEVQTVVNAVTAAGGTIDTVAEVQSVVNAVTAAGGSIDLVQTVVDAVTTAGGHIDTVASAGIDPAAQIAAVTRSVPFPFRDSFFWPALSGEQFAPSLGGSSYISDLSRPAYGVGTTAGNVVQSPALPRVGFNGKEIISFECAFFFGGNVTVGPWGAVANNYGVGFGNGTTGAGAWPTAFFKFNRLAAASGALPTYDVYCVTQTGVASPVVANFATKAVHILRIEASAAGVVKFFIDGVLVYTTPTNDWPSNATVSTAFWSLLCIAGGATNAGIPRVAAPSVAWS